MQTTLPVIGKVTMLSSPIYGVSKIPGDLTQIGVAIVLVA